MKTSETQLLVMTVIYRANYLVKRNKLTRRNLILYLHSDNVDCFGLDRAINIITDNDGLRHILRSKYGITVSMLK